MKAALLWVLAAACCLAQPPRIRDTRVETRSAAAGLEAAIKSLAAAQSARAWIGWSAPLVAGDRTICWNESGGVSRRAIELDAPRVFSIFLRIESGLVAKVRAATPDCEIDGNGAVVYWFTGVRPEQSVAYLSTLVHVDGGKGSGHDGVISAIALHDNSAADSALERLAAPSEPEAIRKKAIFWMGVARGRRGFETLTRIVREDPADKIREHAVFALSQSKQPGAVGAVIAVARDDRSAHFRGQALFWLAQTAQRQVAADAITRALEKDPETEVKKKAVFALAQLPNHDGVPKLIDVARNHPNPEVRKQAMFWLGQSKDPRALQFFESVLTGVAARTR